MHPWEKFAILGSTYARALGNAATRAGREFAPEAFASIHAQPLAKLDPHASSFARGRAAPGELPMTPQRQNLQQFLHRTPWATDEHTGITGGSDHAVGRFNELLDETGRSHAAPTGQPTTQQRITQSFGRPGDPQHARTQVGRPREGGSPTLAGRPSPPAQQMPGGPKGMSAPPGKSLMDLMDDPGVPTTFGRLPVRPPAGRMQGTQAAVASGMPPHAVDAFLRGAAPSAIPGGNSAAGDATAVMRKTGSALSTGAAFGIPLAIGGGLLLNKPGIKADISNRLHGTGDIHQKDMEQEIPEAVQGQASRAAQALAARGINPSALRVAVDAPSGAGKTVLSKALASQLGLQHHGLDWRPHMRMHQLMGGGDIEKTPYAPHAGEILEHQQLLRSYDPELFDVAIHMHKSPEVIKQQLLQRGRGARTHDLLDYDKSLAVGQKAFETLGGESIDLGDGTMMKIRPQEGWGNALDQQLAQMGVDTTGLSRHEKLLSLNAGARTTGSGWTPYAKSPFTGAETAAIGASIPLGLMAAKALARRPL